MKQPVRCIFTIFILGAVFLSSPGAQEVEPEEPEIVLPPMLLETKDLREENIEAFVPLSSALEASAMEIALPEAEKIVLPAEAFEVELPDQPSIVLDGGTAPPREDTFFSEGMIGAGSMNHIVGDITLYKLGQGPRFSLHFSHERLDGFGFRPPGQGFFRREDAVDGSLRIEQKNFNMEGEAGYREVERGLQGVSTLYTARSNGYLWGDFTGGFSPGPFLFEGGLLLKYTNSILSGAEPKSDSELYVIPSLSGAWEGEKISLSLNASYQLQTLLVSDSTLHNLHFNLQGRGTLSEYLTLGGDIGAFFQSQSGWKVPFSVFMDGVGKTLSYRVSGGFRTEPILYTSLWQLEPYLSTGGVLKEEDEWYTRGEIKWLPHKTFTIRSHLNFSYNKSAVIPDYSGVNAAGLFPFSRDEQILLQPGLSVDWSPLEAFSTALGWEGEFDLASSDPSAHRFTLGMDSSDSDGRYGGSLEMVFPLEGSFALPFFSLEGFFQLTKGVRISLEGLDLLAPVLEEGRISTPPFAEPGFHIIFKTNISL